MFFVLFFFFFFLNQISSSQNLCFPANALCLVTMVVIFTKSLCQLMYYFIQIHSNCSGPIFHVRELKFKEAKWPT